VAVEVDAVAVRTGSDVGVVLGAGSLGDEIVRTASWAVAGLDECVVVGLALCATAFTTFALTTFALAGVALASFGGRQRELLAETVAPVADVAGRATGVALLRGKPCTTATAAPTASAPPSAPTVAHDSAGLRRAIDAGSHGRGPRCSPSSDAQKATPP
jgi:hypothetical protein